MPAALPGSGYAATAIFAKPGTLPSQPAEMSEHRRLTQRCDRHGPSSIFGNTRWQGGGPPGASPFAPAPDIGALDATALAWNPALDLAVLTLVRPVSWARPVGDLRFEPERWGDRLIRIAAPAGTHLIVRRHGAPDLHLWLPARLGPAPGGAFGLYLHPDLGFADRTRAAATFRRAIGRGAPIRAARFRHAHRQAAMLCIHDLAEAGTPLRAIAGLLLDPMPGDWRSSSERSDLRRLLEAASGMIAGGYRRLLGSHPHT